MDLRMNFVAPLGPRRVPGTGDRALTVRPVQSGFGGVMDGYMGALPAGYQGATLARTAHTTQPIPSREGARLRSAAQSLAGVGGCGVAGLGGKLDCGSTGQELLTGLMTIGGAAAGAFGGKTGARIGSTLNAGVGVWNDACQRRAQAQSTGGGSGTSSGAGSTSDAMALFLGAQRDAAERDAARRDEEDRRRVAAAAAKKSDQTKWMIGGAVALGVVALIALR